MGRKPKLSIAEIKEAAADRRHGATWKELSIKYKCCINTLRKALSEHSEEFAPIPPTTKIEVLERLTTTEKELTAIKKILKKRFNIHL